MSQIQTATITGMHCGACEKLITKRFQNIDGVSEVSVSVDTQQASIKAERTLSMGELQQALEGTEYHIINLT